MHFLEGKGNGATLRGHTKPLHHCSCSIGGADTARADGVTLMRWRGDNGAECGPLPLLNCQPLSLPLGR